MSLMEPKRVAVATDRQDSLYVDARFKDTPFIWTADEYSWDVEEEVSRAWYVDFVHGYCHHIDIDIYYVNYVRAVR